MNSTENIRTIFPADYPRLLKEAVTIMDDPPKEIYIRGDLPSDDHIFLTVVGSRQYSEYGKAACESLIAGLHGLPVVIVSGLALGIDSIAHEAALAAGLQTIAVPGSGLADEMLYPPTHIGIARRILAAGGCLLSPFEKTVMGNKWTFPYRNAIMAGLSHATLVIEAATQSGTLITARRAMDFYRDVLVVPGSIFSKKSEGAFEYMREGATPIACAEDLIFALGLEDAARARDTETEKIRPLRPDLTESEQRLIAALAEPRSRDRLIQALGIQAAEANALIS